ncbi:sodium/potassium-transporting ATPase subunit beta-1-like isoform X2 [Cloeon dipterum]|uniref:sodium/potassium-transporting ATPase subunit beta-1-like isoform X2 n=1 Tax=Cloeon dipterum TaxID=197152 RepID=UPI003220167B
MVNQTNMLQLQDDSGQVDIKPAKPKFASDFRTFVYNRNEGKYLGRTPLSWVKVILFYCVFYLLLCGFTFAMWRVFMSSYIDGMTTPRRLLHDSVIGANPAITMRPTGVDYPDYLNIESSSTSDLFSDEVATFLKPYNRHAQDQEQINCGQLSDHQLDRSNESCFVDMSAWEHCKQSDGFGYTLNQPAPCIFLKLNRVHAVHKICRDFDISISFQIFNWVPEFYTSTKELPEDMPTELNEHISELIGIQGELNKIWVSCEGVTEIDKRNLGEVKYIPEKGFPGYYYPFVNAKGYLSPLVAVQLVNLTRNVEVRIKCRAWAKNLNYDSNKEGIYMKFRILIH